MTVMNTEKKIAILAANGFEENHMTILQRSLTQAGMTYKVVAPEQGLVNGWQGSGWGHYFTVDASISTTLGSDYDVLIVIGGERSAAKLKQNPHARRIINHFLEASKPLAAIGAGVALLGLSESIANRTLSAPDEVHADLKIAKAIISAESQELDGMVLSSTGENADTWAAAVLPLIASYEVPEDEEAESVAA